MPPLRRLALPCALLLALASLAVPAAPAPQGPEPAAFLVGAAVRDITPGTPQWLGGYGSNRLSQGVLAPLQVRALAVANASGSAVLLAEVDSQGYFAGYQEGPYGTLDVRQRVSDATGLPVGHIVVGASHSHAAPTIMGIWGPTDPAYLRLVHDQVIAALEAAWAAREPARISTAVGQASDLIATDVPYGDVMPGWPVDGTLAVLRAMSPDGRDVATLVTFGVHPDILGGDTRLVAPDWLGPARDFLQARLGGVVLTAPGTLGHQESPIEDSRGGDPFDQVQRFGELLGARALALLPQARALTSDAVDGDMETLAVPATNPFLLALNLGLSLEPLDDSKPIDRAILPPFAAPPVILSEAGALRIGDELLFTLPGEAFREVAQGVRDHAGNGLLGAPCRADLDVGLAQDQLGYHWLAWETANAAPVGDFLIFDVDPALGDLVAQLDLLAAAKVGCATSPFAPVPELHGLGTILDQYPFAVQALAFPDAVVPGQPVLFEAAKFHGDDRIAWDLGDGGSASGERAAHAYAQPGTYTARADATSAQGEHASWNVTVRVLPAPTAAIAARDLGAHTLALQAQLAGGSGQALQARWDFGDGQQGWGLAATHAYPAAGTYEVRAQVADASGLVAGAAQAVSVA